MAFVDLEDMAATIEVIVFPSLFQKHRELIQEDKVISIKGRVDKKEDQIKLIALELIELKKGEQVEAKGDKDLVVRLSPAQCKQETMLRLKDILRSNPGPTPVLFELVENDSVTKMKIGPDFKVDGNNRLIAEIMELLGAGSVVRRSQNVQKTAAAN